MSHLLLYVDTCNKISINKVYLLTGFLLLLPQPPTLQAASEVLKYLCSKPALGFTSRVWH